MIPGLPIRLQAYVALIGAAGVGWLGYLAQGAAWGPSALGEAGVFVLLLIAAGSYPLPVAPRATANVATAVLFGAVLLLEPGPAAVAAVVGKLASYLLVRFWGDRLRLPGYKFPIYKYPFNLGETALSTGLTSLLFHSLAPDESLLVPGVVAAAAAIYLANTALVTGAVHFETGISPLRFWWMGTRENGLAELSLLAFGFLGALVYQLSPWTIMALFIPVAIIYVAFSRLARSNAQLEEALEKLEALQGQILSTSKLTSVGAISMDLAHQIKNPLAILLGRLEGLQDQLEEGSRARSRLDIALEAGWRIHQLTDTFTAIGQQKRVELDVLELVSEALGTAGTRNPKRVETSWQRATDLPKVEGNPVLLREALSNILSNAIEAVAEGGKITIAVSQDGGAIVTRISDNGPGIPQEQRAHLFEPFYTTKPGGQGLGLFAAKHILEMHGGTVDVETKEGEGTEVKVTLPAFLSEAEKERDGPEDSNGTQPWGRS